MSEIEIRCRRCDDHILTRGDEKVILMQHPLVEIEEEMLFDQDSNEITDGKIIKCHRCTLRMKLDDEFSIKNVVPKPENIDKVESKKSRKWLQKQMMLGRRKPKISRALCEIQSEMLLGSVQVRIVDEGKTKKGAEIAVYEQETRNFILEIRTIKAPGANLLANRFTQVLMDLLAWSAIEQGTNVLTETPYATLKLMGVKDPGGKRYRQVLDTWSWIHDASYSLYDKKEGGEPIRGHFIDRIEPDKKTGAFRLYIDTGWIKDSYKLVTKESGARYLYFPDKNIMSLELPLLHRNFGIWLATQRGQKVAHKRLGDVLKMGYADSTIARKLKPQDKWEKVKACIMWAAKSGYYKSAYTRKFGKEISGYFKVVGKNGREFTCLNPEDYSKQLDWKSIADWVIFVFPVSRFDKRAGKKLTQPG